jgi:cation-dependent mannose-6-phosphate receptor
MVSRSRLLLLAAATLGFSLAADEKTTTTTACTATATGGKAYFDLRPDIAVAPKTRKHKRAKSEDYTARGYDYGYNFTLNICEAVIQKPEKVVGIDEALWKNVSAYYEGKDGKTYSLG